MTRTVATTPVRIATVRGIDVRMAPSWLLIAAAIAWGYQRTFAGDGRSLVLTIGMGLAAAVLFTGSVLFHELAHALEGTHRDIEVAGITLFLLGGATALRDPDRRAIDEFAVAAVGPWSNIVLAAVFGLLSLYANSWGLVAVADVAGLLGWLNLGLALFNLVPGAPLDGGRILRAAVWAVTGDRNRATVVAAWVGVALALGLIGLTVWLATARGALWAAVWVGLIGAYVLHAARTELVRGHLSVWLSDLTAGELAPALPHVTAGATTGALTDLLEQEPAAVLVLRDNEPIGVVRPGDVPTGEPSRDPGGDASRGTAASHARPLEGLPVVSVDDPGDRLVGLLDRDQPLVLVRGDDGAWLSSLHLIDRRIRDLRGAGVPPSEVPA